MRALRWLSLVAAALLVAGCGQSAKREAPAPPASAVPASATSHVVVVVMENEEYADIVGNREAAYVNKLVRRSALVRSYAIRHPSLPNYLALTGGSTFGVSSDCTSCHVSARNLVDQLDAAGVTWKAYMEGMPHRCFKGADSDDYAKKHDPFAYYDDVATNRRRCDRIVPASQLTRDLRSDRLPTFAWVTPDLCNDMHDCSIATGDRYLSRLVPALLRGIGPHGVVIVTWDEGSSDAGCCGVAHGGRIATILSGPDVARGARPAGAFTHYSTLRTIENLLRLPPLGGAASATPLNAAFATAPAIR